MGDSEKKSGEAKGLLDGIEPNFEAGVKDSHEDKRFERGVGNRKPKGPPEAESKREFGVGPFFKAKVQDKPLVAVDTRAPGKQETTFGQVLRLQVGDVEALSASANLDEGKVKLVAVKHKSEASVVHSEIDIVDIISKLFVSETKKPPPEPPPPPPPPPAPSAARVGDLTVHGSPLLPGIGSPNVMIGGMPAWRAVADVHICPFPSTPPHGIGSVMQGATTVLINGMPAVRAGDLIVEPTGGPNMVAMGFPTVMIGPPAVPPPPPTPPSAAAPKPPSVMFESVAKVDVGAAEVELQGYAEVDLSQRKAIAEGQAGGMVALVKGEIPMRVRFPLPGTEYSLGIGITIEGSLLSAGAEVGGGVKINDGAKFFDATGGAKIGAGVGGVGVKFNFDCSK